MKFYFFRRSRFICSVSTYTAGQISMDTATVTRRCCKKASGKCQIVKSKQRTLKVCMGTSAADEENVGKALTEFCSEVPSTFIKSTLAPFNVTGSC